MAFGILRCHLVLRGTPFVGSYLSVTSIPIISIGPAADWSVYAMSMTVVWHISGIA